MVENTIAPIVRKGETFVAVNAATTTGLANANRFVLPQDGSLDMTDVTIQGIGTYTVCTIGIEVSLDGGTTFGELATADLFANRVVRNDLGRSGIYRINVKTFTGTSVTVKVGIP
jgi:hypothetical protein